MSCIAFCNDGCTIAAGTTAGRVVTYNLKDVKGSKRQLQIPRTSDSGVALSVSTLLFKRPVKAEKTDRQSVTSKASEQKSESSMYKQQQQQQRQIETVTTNRDESSRLSKQPPR